MPTDTNEQRLERELLRERFALDSLLEFAQILTPNLGIEGIIRTVERTVMGKGLITRSFAYIADSDEKFKFLNAIGYPRSHFPDSLTFEQMEEWFIKSPHIDIRDEPNYLESLSLVTGLALSNAKLFALEKERERLSRELEIAREIQTSLLPPDLPKIPGYSFASYSQTSEVVGGDYYDVIPLTPERIVICIADVVGKGIGAAILMSNLQAGLHSHIRSLRLGTMTLEKLVEELNEMITASTTPERYITAVFAELNIAENMIRSIVCGHPKPFIIHQSGGIDKLPTNGIPLGIIADHTYSVSERRLDNNDLLVFYTDGLSEARLNNNGMLGNEGVEKLF
jgi:hypothetical protein